MQLRCTIVSYLVKPVFILQGGKLSRISAALLPANRPWALICPLCQDLGRCSLSLSNYPWQARRAHKFRPSEPHLHWSHVHSLCQSDSNSASFKSSPNRELVRASLELWVQDGLREIALWGKIRFKKTEAALRVVRLWTFVSILSN